MTTETEELIKDLNEALGYSDNSIMRAHPYAIDIFERTLKELTTTKEALERQIKLNEHFACETCGGTGVVGSPPDDYFDCPECKSFEQMKSENARLEEALEAEVIKSTNAIVKRDEYQHSWSEACVDLGGTQEALRVAEQDRDEFKALNGSIEDAAIDLQETCLKQVKNLKASNAEIEAKAIQVAYTRMGDLSTEDGVVGVVEINALIELCNLVEEKHGISDSSSVEEYRDATNLTKSEKDDG